MQSLRFRLFITLLSIFVAAWMVLAAYVCTQYAQGRSGEWDRGLDEIGRVVLLSMPADIDHISSTANLRLNGEVPSMFAKRGRLTFQVWVKSRQLIVVRSYGGSSEPLKPNFTDGFSTEIVNGEEWRVFAISDARNEVQVQVGKPTSELGRELKTGLYYALIISLAALMVVAVAIKLVVRWSLRSVVAVQAAATSRDAFDLAPLPDQDLPCEVRPLVESFNRLLGRLEHTMQAERRFLTEAAHELRTPLAVLLTHAQVAQRSHSLDEARAALDQLVRGVERSARLSQQLLDSARLDAERRAGEQAPFELADVVAVVTHEFEIVATQKQQSISLDTESGIILGNLDDLGILIRNLIDNALRYAGVGCHVAVRCLRKPTEMRLEVFDDGPGVAEGDRERIFDRFYRGAGNGERGSGIGLALVARIAKTHAATIMTGAGLDGRGFGVTVSFPLFEESAALVTESADQADDGAKIDMRPARASS